MAEYLPLTPGLAASVHKEHVERKIERERRLDQFLDQAAAAGKSAPEQPRRSRRRKRRTNPSMAAKSKSRLARQSIEDAILAEWKQDRWKERENYVQWRNGKGLPAAWVRDWPDDWERDGSGSPQLTVDRVRLATDAAKGRLDRIRKPAGK